MKRSTTLAWIFAGVSTLLFLSSFRGNGTGLFGSGVIIHWLWSYVFLLLGAVLALWLSPQVKPKNLEEPTK